MIAARGRAARSSLTTLHRSSGRRVAGWNRESSTALAGGVFASGVRHHRSSEAAVLEGGDGGDPAEELAAELVASTLSAVVGNSRLRRRG